MRQIVCCFVVAVVVGTCVQALADTPGAVGLGSARLITVAAVPGMTLEQRVSILQARLVDILSVVRRGEHPNVQVKCADGSPVITVRGIHFVTVTPHDAKLHASTPKDLASLWAKHIDSVLRRVAPSRQRPAAPRG